MLKVNRQQIMETARSWVGTPFHHQARLKGHGVDCAQLVIGVGMELGLIPEYPRQYMNYGRVPRPDFMRERLQEFMDEIPAADAVAGDVLWMGWRKGIPMHLGILTELHGRGVIHAYSEPGFVVETVLNPAFESLIDSWWRYRGIVE